MTTTTNRDNSTIKIFITNLGKYNEGHLVGEWVNLPMTEEEKEAVLERIGINEEYEEYFITDYETDLNGFKIGEYDSIDELNELADELESLDEYEREIIEACISNGLTFDEAMEQKDDCTVYYNCNDMSDVAEQYADETGLLNSIPENLQSYFDFEAFGRDMGYEGTFIFTNNGNCVQIY
ncbi:antirestriction protein ArdA [Konateibacter massiliensis]|uniref:antirestriction protein ArdA n=1 Tax=Konateibacter massiliensis TaxID=2002841 RepID=UPI001F39E69D|nr:antirestriction protein ArdA [Konateibacter massiliensis]